MLSRANNATLRDVAAALGPDKWLYDFLFTSDALSDISLLTSPSRAAHTTVVHRTTSGVERSASHAQIFDFELDALSIYLPAFSVDGVTAGLAIHQRTVSKRLQRPEARARPTTHFTRFARHEERATLVEVRHHAADAALELACTLIRSPKRKSHVTLHMEAPRITHHHLASPARFADALAASVTQIAKTEYCRSCPQCGVEPAAHCACRNAGKRPRHPLDFRQEARNMAVYNGEYEGGSVVEMFRAGEQELQTLLECRDSVRMKRDVNVQTMLQRKGIVLRLSSYRHLPARSLPLPRTPVKREHHAEPASPPLLPLAEQLLRGAGDPASEELETNAADSGGGDEGEPGGGDARAETQCVGEGDRREKNRMSAAKSNLKRKRKNKLLRMNLVMLRETVSNLRERQDELRCENAWLRCQLELRAPSGMNGRNGGNLPGGTGKVAVQKLVAVEKYGGMQKLANVPKFDGVLDTEMMA